MYPVLKEVKRKKLSVTLVMCECHRLNKGEQEVYCTTECFHYGKCYCNINLLYILYIFLGRFLLSHYKLTTLD